MSQARKWMRWQIKPWVDGEGVVRCGHCQSSTIDEMSIGVIICPLCGYEWRCDVENIEPRFAPSIYLRRNNG